MAKKKSNRGKANSKWDDTYYVRIYQMLLDGVTREGIASSLGVSTATLAKWIKEKPAVADLVQRVESVRSSGGRDTLEGYIYKMLPPGLRAIWEELEDLEKEGNTIRQMDILREQPEASLQHLFIHALVSSNFDPSTACRRIGISYKRVQRWSSDDEEFGQLIKEVMWHKKNFFESCLAKLVASGDSAATVFVNKTLNRDRGYDTKVPSEVNVNVTNIIEVDDLDMDIEAKRQLLEAIRKRRSGRVGDVIEMPAGSLTHQEIDE